MTDIDSELETLKAQVATLMAMKGDEVVTSTSIWAVYDTTKTGVWCSKTDCPKLKRKVTFDVAVEVESDEGLEAIIKTGLSEKEAEEYENRKKRVGSPTLRYHDLGVIAAFTSEKKATDFIERYFKINQGSFDPNTPPDICLSEIVIHD